MHSTPFVPLRRGGQALSHASLGGAICVTSCADKEKLPLASPDTTQGNNSTEAWTEGPRSCLKHIHVTTGARPRAMTRPLQLSTKPPEENGLGRGQRRPDTERDRSAAAARFNLPRRTPGTLVAAVKRGGNPHLATLHSYLAVSFPTLALRPHGVTPQLDQQER